MKIKVTTKIHELYDPNRNFMAIGKYHRIYSKGDRKISLIELIGFGDMRYESYGYGSKYEKRYETLSEALTDINRRLNRK